MVASSLIPIRKGWCRSESTAIYISPYGCISNQLLCKCSPGRAQGNQVYSHHLASNVREDPTEIWFPKTDIRNVKMNKEHFLAKLFTNTWLPTFLPTTNFPFLLQTETSNTLHFWPACLHTDTKSLLGGQQGADTQANQAVYPKLLTQAQTCPILL